MMVDSVYKLITLVGTSTKSWEDAMATVIALAAKNLRDLRIAEVEQMDVKLEDGKIAEQIRKEYLERVKNTTK